jgi:hypothetical protein
VTTRKGQNSILFLTTLGVYLGLVLVGAPHVLAQAATARQFDVKDEIEKKDDLDKGPDGCGLLQAKVADKQKAFSFDNASLFNYISSLRAVYAAAQELGSESFLIEWNPIGAPDNLTTPGAWANDNRQPVLLQGTVRRALDKAFLSLSQVFPTTGPDDKHLIGFSLNASKSDIDLASKFTRFDDVDAHRAFIAYTASMDFWRCAAKTPADRLLAHNTDVSWTGNQLLLVTHLPRGSLDELLAKDAK